MTDDLSRDLETIQVPAIPNDYAALKALIQTLPAPLSPEIRSATTGITNTATPGVTSAAQTAGVMGGVPPGMESGASLGVVSEIFYGNSNILSNPALDNPNIDVSDVPAAPSYLTFARDWRASYVVESGTAPTTAPDVTKEYYRESTDTPFNTAQYAAYLYGHATGTEYTLRCYSAVPWYPNIDSLLPFLTASMKVSLYGSSVDAACTVLKARVIITSGDGSTIRAAGEWHDFKAAGIANDWTVRRLSVSLARTTNWYSSNYNFALEVRYGRSDAGGMDYLAFGEPVLALSSTQSPPPYSPIIAKWNPGVLACRLAGDTYDRVYVGPSNNSPSTAKSRVQLGGGASAMDIKIERSAAGRLVVSSPSGTQLEHALVPSSSSDRAKYEIRVTGDTEARFTAWGDGTLAGINLGPGNAALDTNLYRSAANTLKTDDKLLVGSDTPTNIRGVIAITLALSNVSLGSTIDMEFGDTSGNIVSMRSPFKAEVVGLSITAESARSSGTLTAQVYNETDAALVGMTAVLDGTTTNYAATTDTVSGTPDIDAGDLWRLRLTPSSYSPSFGQYVTVIVFLALYAE